MIHFVCEHCGRAVRVNGSAAGKKGRCPLCGAVVTVPRRSVGTGANGEIESLAAALQSQAADRAETTVVPPPPTVAGTPSEELHLDAPDSRSLEETDVLPAIPEPAPPADGWSRRRRRRAKSTDTPAVDKSEDPPPGRKRLCLVAMAAVALVIALTAVAVLFAIGWIG